MKTVKKFCGLAVLSVLVTTVSFAACGRQKVEENNSGKSVLYVSNYAGGFGEEWMNEIEKRFETTYTDAEFEPGKKGVDIKVSQNKTLGNEYFNKVESVPEEVFFVEKIDYAAWVNQGKMLDISDIVTENNSRDNGKSILSKMSDEEQNYYKSEGAYYALPHHEHQAGLIYDIDLFEQEELYFAENGAPSESGYTGMAAYTGTGNKSAGPDGKYETADDGLPATYDEFYMLCNYMISKQSDVDITPILWSGTNRNDYIDWFLSELTADFEGEKQLKLNYTFDGIAKNLIAIDKNGAVSELEDTKISSSNGYLVYQSEGRYRALEFFDKVVDTKAWYNESANFGSLSHTEAQYNYLLGATGLSDTRYAFLIDGCWWENEATDSFDSIVDRKGEEFSKTSRRFAFMPLPKAMEEQIGDPFTIATTDVTMGFIKSNISASKIDLAKTFLKFCYEDEQLKMFNTVSGLPAAVDYSLDDDEYKSLSRFGKSIYDVKDKVVAPYSQNPIYVNNFETLKLASTFVYGGKHAVDALRTTDAASYFRSLYSAKNETSWTQSYSKYF